MILALATAMVLAGPLAGCNRRKEVITVARDGRVEIELEYQGDPNDMTSGDAMPSEAGGWETTMEERIIGKEDNGEPQKEITLTGHASFGPGEQLPFTYADPLDPDADLYLRFPTTLTVEERQDGTYYHFYRVYGARPWAQIEAWRKEIQEGSEEQWKQIEGKDASALTHADRVLLIQVLVFMEQVKMENFARWAMADMQPDRPQECWSYLVMALRSELQDLDFDRLAELMAADAADGKCEALEAEAETLQTRMMETMRSALLEECGLTLNDYDTFMERYEWHRKHYEITQDLGDDHFEIHVEMPGEIVATNAHSYDQNEAQWEFDGDMFRDRIVELTVTSRVAE
jgi:hypothetical protein